jgi:hypothetical protein
VLGPPLPPPFTPTIAIDVAPAAVATFVAFVIEPQDQERKIFCRCHSRYFRAGGLAPTGSSRASRSGGRP